MAVVALAIVVPPRVAAARVRLNAITAITARTSQAAFALKIPDGRWARAEFFMSAWTCSIIAWPRWVLSAITVSRVLVVKNAWKRQVWNRVAWPAFAWGLRSGIRRTDEPPGDLVGLLPCGKRGERNLGDLCGRAPRSGGLVKERVDVLDCLPRVIGGWDGGQLLDRGQRVGDQALGSSR